MAQKTKPATKGSTKSKARGAKPPAKKKAARPTPRTLPKTKPRASAKPVAAKPAQPVKKPGGTKPVADRVVAPKKAPAAPARGPAAVAAPVPVVAAPAPRAAPAKPAVPDFPLDPQIARAKSALKRQKPGPTKTGGVRAERARARKLTIEINANEAASALAAKWSTLFKRSEQIDAQPYSMTSSFEERTAIVHKVLGWGYILANRNDRLEVLFKDGIKYLISNYKP